MYSVSEKNYDAYMADENKNLGVPRRNFGEALNENQNKAGSSRSSGY